jgi:hypothetical protein
MRPWVPNMALSWPRWMIPTSSSIVRSSVAIPNKPTKIVYADKGYVGGPNRSFLSENKITDGIMRKDSTTAKLTELENE